MTKRVPPAGKNKFEKTKRDLSMSSRDPRDPRDPDRLDWYYGGKAQLRALVRALATHQEKICPRSPPHG